MDYSAYLLNYCRPSFYALCKEFNRANAPGLLFFDLLVECIATVKMANKSFQLQNDIPAIANELYNGNPCITFLNKSETVGGFNQLIEYEGKSIILKCFTREKASLSRALLDTLQQILKNELKKCIFRSV